MDRLETKDTTLMTYDSVNVIQDNERFFRNNAENSKTKFMDYIDNSDNKLSANFAMKMLKYRNKLLNDLLKNLKESENTILKEDITVYTGISGIAMLYLKIAKEGDQYSYLKERALKYLRIACTNKKYESKLLSRPTFLCGLAGPLVLNAIAAEDIEEEKTEMTGRKSAEILLQILQSTITNDRDLPNELLYGRAGYLYSLLLLKKSATPSISSTISDESIKAVALSIINNGVRYAKQTRRHVPMWWEWHDKEYIGAAHGICGILFMLLSAKPFIPEESLINYIKPTLDYFAHLQYPSGNFPSSITGRTPPTNDKLLHWCHGAPGAVHLLLKAHEIWPNNDDSYLIRAQKCGEAVWRRGLLKKGYGLCHGVAGNTYAFLALWKTTKDYQYLYKSAVFAEWCFDYGKRGCPDPDRPLSLFEGLAGTIYLLTDMIQNPELACFPAFSDI